MTSVHRKMKLVFVHSDGEGGFVLKANVEGEVIDTPLDLKTCVRLSSDLSNAARQLIEQAEKTKK